MAALPVVVPLDPLPAQLVNVTLGTQPCKIKVFTRSLQVPVWDPGDTVTDPPRFAEISPVFLDLYVNDVAIFYGALCRNEVKLKRSTYLRFTGDLSFQDLQGSEDPQVDGLGSRWVLCWWADL